MKKNDDAGAARLGDGAWLRGEGMKRWLVVLVPMVVMPGWIEADEASARLQVTARVSARTIIQALSEPATFTVSAHDLSRGFVDVAAVFRVSSNDPAGYVVQLAPRVGITSTVEVSGLASRVLMRDDVVEVLQPPAMRPQLLDLRFRLVLDPAVVPGTYDLPVRVAVASL